MEPPEPPAPDQKKGLAPQPESWILLTTAENEVEADAVASLLDSCGIPADRRYQSGGNYLRHYMGGVALSTLEIYLYVQEERLEEAREILATQLSRQELEVDPEAQVERFEHQRKAFLRPLAWMAVAGLALMAVAAVIALVAAFSS